MSNKYSLAKNECLPYIKFDNSYSFFDGVVSYLAGICSSSFVLYTYLSGGSLYTENHYIYFEGREKATNCIYYLFPYDIFKPLLNNCWPTSIKLFYKEKTFPDSVESENEIHGFKQVFLDLGQATYIQFWEKIKQKIISQFSNVQNSWPNIFQFGWIIRNALAHNFKIEINDKKVKNVSW